MDADRARTSERTEVVLLSARHPGLTGRAIPIDIRLGDGYTALVVTGPNTGGKTVTLRTLGLLSLMHQAGLHIPAAAGQQPADLARCLRRHRRRAIGRPVALDVLRAPALDHPDRRGGRTRARSSCSTSSGPGTDPTEGSALAQALLDHFIQAGALVAATTHYAELKAYAHTTEGARNAAVEFDLETLSPTYRLTIGLPGGSQAFAIAERLGLPQHIVEDAKSRLTDTQRSLEETLAALKATEGETSASRDQARSMELRTAEALRDAAEERRRARRERDEIVTERPQGVRTDPRPAPRRGPGRARVAPARGPDRRRDRRGARTGREPRRPSCRPSTRTRCRSCRRHRASGTSGTGPAA